MIWLILLGLCGVWIIFSFIFDCNKIASITMTFIYVLILLAIVSFGIGEEKTFAMDKKNIELKIENFNSMKKSFTKQSNIDLANNSYFTEVLKTRKEIVDNITRWNNRLLSRKLYKEYSWFNIAINDFKEFEYMDLKGLE